VARMGTTKMRAEVWWGGLEDHLEDLGADGTIILKCILNKCGPGSAVGKATGYGPDGPRIEFRWGRDFPHLSRPALGPTQPPVQWILGLSRG
jgi:hypothetical protein